MKQYTLIALVLFILTLLPSVLGDSAEIDEEISEDDKEKFDAILAPVLKIYNFIKYIASVVAGIFLLYAGITYMSSGSDPKKRDQAKGIASYVVIGLIVIWAAPFIVGLLI